MKTAQEKITLDATNKRLGRLASEIAHMLSGKSMVGYAPNKTPNITVEVTNAAKMQISEKKKKRKIYERYTGYFGGRKELTLSQVIEKKGHREALRKAIYGMLPNNKLRNEKMKKVHINE